MKYFYSLLFILIILSCSNSKNKVKSNKTDKISEAFTKQSKSLVNKSLVTIKKIVGESKKHTGKVVLVYSGFDCDTCIKIGFEMMQKIDTLKNESILSYIIASQSNIHDEQLKYNYFEYIYIDKEDVIRKELKYIHTPAILYLDSNERIKNVVFPNYVRSDENILKEQEFIEFVVSKK